MQQNATRFAEQEGRTVSSSMTVERSYMGWDEAAVFTGLSVSSLRRMVESGKLRAYRPTAGRVLLSRAELVQAIEGDSDDPAPAE